MRRHSTIFVVLILVGMASSCASQRSEPTTVPLVQGPYMPADFSGSWERNYSRGGDIQENVNRLARRLNRSVAGANTPNSRRGPGVTSSSPSLGPIIAMARIADEITRSDTLLIEHDSSQIEVVREEDFALTCEFNNSTAQQFASPLGQEICGWDGRKMVFHVTLPDGVTITHRLTLSPDQRELNVATTVTSPSSYTPYTLNRFYNRFEPVESPYVCVQTLSRKRVCEFKESGDSSE